MKKLIAGTAAGIAILISATPLFAKVLRGEATDPNYSQLGTVRYLGTPAGYHFWFTPTADLAWYETGHSYHNVYQLEVDSMEGWCGTTVVPNREPYNLVGHTGEMVYYKIIDTTNGGNICP